MSLLDRKVRGFKLVDVVALALLAALVLGVYLAKTIAGRERAGRTPAGSRHAPPVAQGPAPSFRLLFNSARTPSPAEAAANPRARSAKLRAAVRTSAPVWRRAA